MATIFKVSYVVAGEQHPGAILNTETRPQTGDRVRLGSDDFVVDEVIDLMPPRGDFQYLHVTVRPPEE
jgi:tRNA(Glu) U13 pseudouridine synthase TruD